MMRVTEFLMLAVVAALVCAVPAVAQDFYALSVPEMAGHGAATHVAIIDYNDFSAATTTNTTLTLSNSIAANTGVELVDMRLDTAFETANAWTNSVALTVGDGTDADLFLSSTELASDGTEVFVKYERPHSYTIAVTPTVTEQTANFGTAVTDQTGNFGSSVTVQTTTLSYLGHSTNQATLTVVTNVILNTGAAVTNTILTTAAAATNVITTATGTATVGQLGRRLYTSAGNIVYTFIPDSHESLSANTQGSVRLFFRLTEFGG